MCEGKGGSAVWKLWYFSPSFHKVTVAWVTECVSPGLSYEHAELVVPEVQTIPVFNY